MDEVKVLEPTIKLVPITTEKFSDNPEVKRVLDSSDPTTVWSYCLIVDDFAVDFKAETNEIIQKQGHRYCNTGKGASAQFYVDIEKLPGFQGWVKASPTGKNIISTK